MGDPLDRLLRIEVDGEFVLAWACPCGEDKDGVRYVVEWDEPIEGVAYSVCHESCLREVENDGSEEA